MLHPQGLIQQQQAPGGQVPPQQMPPQAAQPGMPPGAPPGGAPAPEGQQGEPLALSSEVTPEEQAQYEKVVQAGLKILFSPKTGPQFEKMLEGGKGDPATTIAHVTSFQTRPFLLHQIRLSLLWL